MISTALSTLGGLAVILGWTWREGSWWTGAIGALVGLAGFLGQCLSVRCPRCRVAVVWYTFKTRNHAEAQAAAFYQPVCPKCGYDPP